MMTWLWLREERVLHRLLSRAVWIDRTLSLNDLLGKLPFKDGVSKTFGSRVLYFFVREAVAFDVLRLTRLFFMGWT